MPKQTVEQYPRLDIQELRHLVDFSQPGSIPRRCLPGAQYADFAGQVIPEQGVWLAYTYEQEQVAYLVAVEYTQPHYGGRRPWWRCPNPACGRRVRILYGGKYWLCRHCYHLTYAVQQLSRKQARQMKLTRHLRSTRRQLGGDVNLLAPFPEQPKGMHHTTYEQLLKRYSTLVAQQSSGIFALYKAGIAASGEGEPLAPGEQVQAAQESLTEDFTAWLARRVTQSPQHQAQALSRLRAANRLTLGQLAQRAGVPYAFAQAALVAELLQPDQGRTTRRKRYRRKLASWLVKLHRLHSAGMSWSEMQAWSQRRWLPGHEDEQDWPRSYQETNDISTAFDF